MITKEGLIADFRNLGVEEGDVLYIRGDMGELGDPREFAGKIQDLFMDALLEAVGKEGTIITSAFTCLYLPWQLTPDKIYTLKTHSYAGTLPRLFLKRSNCLRSKHPSNSCVAIGKQAEYLLKDHNAFSSAYAPIGKAIELNAKIISFGCIESNAGFPTTHYVEEVLGLTRKTLLRGLWRVYYIDDEGNKKLFKRMDPGGCCGRVYTFYKEYQKAGLLKVSSIGRALAMACHLKDEFELEYKLLQNNNAAVSCDNPDCIYCNLLTPRKKYVLWKFVFYKIWVISFKIIRSILKREDWKNVIRARTDYKINEDPIFREEIERLKIKY
ncbi:MAG: AAC(3) family N-acetyltransferase [Odoribacter sp.]